MDGAELADYRRAARHRGLTLSEWVRQTLRRAERDLAGGDVAGKLAAVRTAAEHEFPTGDIDDVLASVYERDYLTVSVAREPRPRFRSTAERDAHLARLQESMRKAAANLDFEEAARLRDEIRQLRVSDLGLSIAQTGGADAC